MPIACGIGIGVTFQDVPPIPAWALGGDLWEDFVAGSGTMPDPTDTHAQTIYAPNAAGLYLPYAPNVLTRTDLGLQTVPTRTNLCLQATDFTTSWNPVLGTTVTANNRTAPDGTNTADQITQDGLGANQGVNQIVETGATIASKTFTGSFFIYSATAFTGTVRIRGNGAVQEAENFSVNVLANQWTRISGTKVFTALADGTAVFFGFIGDFGLSVARTYWLWGGQFELGAFASPPILTTTVAVTVNGNQQVISGLGTQLATGVAGLMQVNILNPAGGTPDPYVLTISDGTVNNTFNLRNNSTNFRASLTSGGVAQAAFNPAAWQIGVVTLAFIGTTNFVNMRIVGQADPGADTLATWPTMDRFIFGSSPAGVTGNIYQFTRKLALDFLTPSDDPATKFAEWYAKAQLAAAA